MKRTTLRTSAIALGVAVALPATAQEWNMGWGGKMSYHVVFGSTEMKMTGYKRTTREVLHAVTAEKEHDITIQERTVNIAEADPPIKAEYQQTSQKARTTLEIDGVGAVEVIRVRQSSDVTTPDTADVDAAVEAEIQEELATELRAIDSTLTGAALQSAIADTRAAVIARVDRATVEGNLRTRLENELKPIVLGENAVNPFIENEDGENNEHLPVTGIFWDQEGEDDIDLDALKTAIEGLDAHEGQSKRVRVYVGSAKETPFEVTEPAELTLTSGKVTIPASENKVKINEATGVVRKVDRVTQSAEKVNEAVKTSGTGMRSDTEVYFTPSVTLDNGLTFGATIEFEADAAGVDQNFISVTGDGLGTLKLGKHGKTGLGVGAPSVGMGINSGDHVKFMAIDLGNGAMSGTNTSIIGNADRISYTTPEGSLGGFGFGISYAPGGDTEDGRTSGFVKSDPKAGIVSDNIDVSLKFAQAFGDANFALGMRYGTAKQEEAKENPRNFGVGASVTFGAFTFGGAYADTVKESNAGKDLSASGWSLGASFKPDEAWTFGIETYQGEADNGDDHSAYKVAASRTLGAGVKWDVYAITANSKTVTVNPKIPASAGQLPIDESTFTKEGKGTIFGTSINLNF